MSFSQTSLQGLKPWRLTGEGEVLMLPGDPGVTFARHEAASISEAVLIALTDSLAPPLYVPERKVVCSASTTPFPLPANVDRNSLSAEGLTLVPCRTNVKAGSQVYAAKLANYADETVVTFANNGDSTYVGCTTGFASNDRPNGALVYVYEGPGIGEVNLVSDYVHSGGTVELYLQFHRQFTATLTTSSKMIVLGSTAAANALWLMGRCDLYDADQIDCIDGIADGDYIMYCDWSELGYFLSRGWVPVIHASALI